MSEPYDRFMAALELDDWAADDAEREILATVVDLEGDERIEAEDLLIDALEVRLLFAPRALGVMRSVRAVPALRAVVRADHGLFRILAATSLAGIEGPSKAAADALLYEARFTHWSAALEAFPVLRHFPAELVRDGLTAVIRTRKEHPLRLLAARTLLHCLGDEADSGRLRTHLYSLLDDLREQGLDGLDVLRGDIDVSEPSEAFREYLARLRFSDHRLPAEGLTGDEAEWAAWMEAHIPAI